MIKQLQLIAPVALPAAVAAQLTVPVNTTYRIGVINAAGTVGLLIVDGTGAVTFGGAATQTTSPTAGGAGALPATPKGYFALTLGSTAVKVPYY